MRRCFFLLGLLSFFTACSPRDEPVSKAAALGFAVRIERSIAAGNPSVLNALLDGRLFGERIAGHFGPADRRAARGAAREAVQGLRFGREVVRNVTPDSSVGYRLVKHYTRGGRAHLVFRLFGESGLNYHDFELVKHKGQLRAADVFIYATGEPLSETMANIMEAAVASSAPAKRVSQQMTAMRMALRADNPAEALSHWNALPADMKSEKTVRLIRIQIASALGEDSLQNAAIDEYVAHYPAGSNVALLMIDSYISRGEWAKAMDAVDLVDSMINRDPFLDYLRGNIAAASGDGDRAGVFYEYMHKALPGFEAGFLEYINNSMDRGERSLAQKLLAEYRADSRLKEESLDVLWILHPEYKSAARR